MGKEKLNRNEKKFFDALCITGNAKQAVIAAGLADSEELALTRAKKYLDRKSIQDALLEREKLDKDIVLVNKDDILRELESIAFSDMSDFIDVVDTEDGPSIEIKDLLSVSVDKRKAIRKVVKKTNKFGSEVSIELHAKLPAISQLTKLMAFDK